MKSNSLLPPTSNPEFIGKNLILSTIIELSTWSNGSYLVQWRIHGFGHAATVMHCELDFQYRKFEIGAECQLGMEISCHI